MPPKGKRQEQLAFQLKEDGNEAFLNSQYDKAIALYTKAIELEQNPIFYNNRSQAYFYTEDLQLALEDCNLALQLNPTYSKAMYNKAQVLFEMGRMEEAIKYLSEIPEQSHESMTLLQKYQEKYKNTKFLVEDQEISKHKILIEWLRSGKSYFPKLKLECYEKNYRGVHANKKINSKELILFVPKTHMITLEMAKDTPISRKILQYKLDLLSPKHSYLSTFLLQEKNQQDSYWKPYLDILPTDYSTFPIFYKNEDMDWLQGSPFQKQVKEKLQDLQRDYHEICLIAPEFQQNTFEQFCWARMTASSRIFGITIKGVKTDAFVPFADMLNHRRPKLTSWMYSDEKQGFIIETDEKIEKGQMIFDSYGRKCNSRFLLNYGFIVEENDANEVTVCISSDVQDPILQQKEMFRDFVNGSKYFRIMMECDENNFQEFMSYCRFTALQDERQLQIYSQSLFQMRAIKTPPISIENEIAMWDLISSTCERQLQQYPTTYEYDQQLVQSKELTINQRNCLLLRLGEKEILVFYRQMGQYMKQILLTNKNEVHIFSQNSQNYKYLNYINRVIFPLMT